MKALHKVLLAGVLTLQLPAALANRNYEDLTPQEKRNYQASREREERLRQEQAKPLVRSVSSGHDFFTEFSPEERRMFRESGRLRAQAEARGDLDLEMLQKSPLVTAVETYCNDRMASEKSESKDPSVR